MRPYYMPERKKKASVTRKTPLSAKVQRRRCCDLSRRVWKIVLLPFRLMPLLPALVALDIRSDNSSVQSVLFLSFVLSLRSRHE